MDDPIQSEKRELRVFLSTTTEIQRFTMFFIVVSALNVSSGFFRSSSGAQKMYMQHRYFSNLCVVTASLVESEKSFDSTRLVVTTHKFDKYRCCMYSL
jgi:phage terminase large subunit-like protein